jgi:hypothetical protein
VSPALYQIPAGFSSASAVSSRSEEKNGLQRQNLEAVEKARYLRL